MEEFKCFECICKNVAPDLNSISQLSCLIHHNICPNQLSLMLFHQDLGGSVGVYMLAQPDVPFLANRKEAGKSLAKRDYRASAHGLVDNELQLSTLTSTH